MKHRRLSQALRRTMMAMMPCALPLLPTHAATPGATKPVLLLSQAKAVVAAAEAEAERNHWPCVIAVVDDGGWLVLQERMDNPAMLASVELAPGKARAAALYRKPTSLLEKAINGGRTAAVTAPGFLQMDGGIPLRIDGIVVGAIGVSADTPEHDLQIGQVGAVVLR